MARDGLYSALAATLAELVTLPLCTIKTNYQNTRSDSLSKTIKEIYARGGIPAFYKASVASVASQTLSTSLKFVFYKRLGFFFGNDRWYKKIANGIGSGVLSTVATHPFDCVKVHLQMNQLDTLASDINSNGCRRVLYRGYTKTLSKVVLGSALFFPLYDTFYTRTSSPVASSLGSAIISTLIIHPVDYLKTRQIYNQSLYQGWNPIPYYRGLSINLLRIVPHFTIVMYTIDILHRISSK